jgi:predicted nucleotidyltransferase
MELRRALSEALAAQPDVVAAWLFGSRARGTARRDSDVDVAVLVDPDAFGPEQAWELEARLSATVGREVQVVVVNRVGADLFRRVLRDGLLLLDRDPAQRIRFEVRKRNEYFDMTPIWRAIRRLPPGMAP